MFLQALNASLLNQSIDWSEDIETAEWIGLLQLVKQHHILSKTFEAVFSLLCSNTDGTVNLF